MKSGKVRNKVSRIARYILLFILIVSSLTPALTADAASGSQGYAVYRDGVFFGLDWHSGFMYQPTSRYSQPIVHAQGSRGTVKIDTWKNFMNDKSFKGVYRPTKLPTSADRDRFVGMARNLNTQNIKYNVAYQIYYNRSKASDYVRYNQITSMRCDGVVEYIYEWYNFRVYGNNSYWDITKNSLWGRDHHSGTAITPKKQVNYLTRTRSAIP